MSALDVSLVVFNWHAVINCLMRNKLSICSISDVHISIPRSDILFSCFSYALIVRRRTLNTHLQMRIEYFTCEYVRKLRHMMRSSTRAFRCLFTFGYHEVRKRSTRWRINFPYRCRGGLFVECSSRKTAVERSFEKTLRGIKYERAVRVLSTGNLIEHARGSAYSGCTLHFVSKASRYVNYISYR